MILHGKNLRVIINGQAVAAAKSCRLSISAQRQEIANQSDGKWRRYKWGRQGWSVQTSHFVTTLAIPTQMVGTTVSLEFSLQGSGLPFTAFVDNVPITAGSCSGTPGAIAWDKTRKQFLAVIYGSGRTQYYQSWTNDDAYAEPSNFDLFSCNGVTYTWVNDELTAEKLTGYADVLQWECTGGVGHLSAGTFEFGGNGALTTASIP